MRACRRRSAGEEPVNAWHLRLAVWVLRQGGQVLHATEGVWGLAADPWNAAAVSGLLSIKGRSQSKGLIVIGASADMFAEEIQALDSAWRRRVTDSWPGPVTWILPTRRFPQWVTGGRNTVAVRVPGHPQARALCQMFGGPLVSTSANLSGHPPARRRLQAVAFRSGLNDLRGSGVPQIFLLPGETLGRAGPSEIRLLDGRYIRRSKAGEPSCEE